MRMRSITAIVVMAVVQAASATAQESATHQLVGFTTQFVTSTNNGALGFTEECQAEFGAEARQCNSVEVMRTTDVPTLQPSFAAWVRPVISGTSNLAFDASGRSGTAEDLTCSGAGTTGLTVGPLGKFGLSPCGNSARVACCESLPPTMATVPLAFWLGHGLLAALLVGAAQGAHLRGRWRPRNAQTTPEEPVDRLHVVRDSRCA